MTGEPISPIKIGDCVTSMVKRDLEEHENRLAEIRGVARALNALVNDEGNDEASSSECSDTDKQVYAKVFRDWADGKINGTAEEIFECVTEVLNS
jgi:hypothetical protein